MRFIGKCILTGLLSFCLPIYAVLNPKVRSYADIVGLALAIQNSGIKDPQEIISVLDAMPYTANALSLISLLHPIAIMRNPKIKEWVEQAKSTLVDGQELISAVDQENSDLIKDLLKNKNIDLNFISKEDNEGAALVCAAKKQEVIFTQMLLDAACDPNVERKKGPIFINEWPPLMFALYFGNSDVALALIKAGANINYKDSVKVTPLMLAASPYFSFTGDSGIEIIKALIASGADTKAKDIEGLTAKGWAKRTYCHNPVYLAKVLDSISRKKHIQAN